MVGREEIFVRVIKGHYSDHACNPSKGTARAELKCCIWRDRSSIPLDRRITVQMLQVLCDPRDNPADGMRSDREQPEVIAVHVFRHEFLAMADVDRDCVVGGQSAQLDRKYRQSFAKLSEAPKS